MNNLPSLPLVIPLATAAVCLLAWNRPKVQRAASLTGALGLVAAALALLLVALRQGPIILAAGGWRPPFGIVLVGDLAGALLVVATSVAGLAVVADSLRSVGPEREAYGYHPLVHILLMGVCGAFLTGDLFNLYVWFEVLLISSFVLLSLGAERPQLEAALKYVTLNLIASAIFLCALGLLYGTLGTLNLADLSVRLANGEGKGFSTPLSMMFLVAFSLKAGLVPLHAWLPASYHTPPASVSALFAGLLTKVGVVALLKVFLLAFRFDPAFTDTILAWMAGLTMVFGGLGAMVQNDVRRLLAFVVLNGVGAMVMGVSLRSQAGTSATFLYLVHSVLASVAAFLLAGEIHRHSGEYDLRRMGGLAKGAPLLCAAWLTVGFALVGVPPLSGFFGKLALVRAGLEADRGFAVGALLVSSLFVLAAFLRAWALAFARDGQMSPSRPRTAPVALAGSTLLFAFLAGPLSTACAQVGRDMSRPDEAAARVLQASAGNEPEARASRSGAFVGSFLWVFKPPPLPLPLLEGESPGWGLVCLVGSDLWSFNPHPDPLPRGEGGFSSFAARDEAHNQFPPPQGGGGAGEGVSTARGQQPTTGTPSPPRATKRPRGNEEERVPPRYARWEVL